MMCKSSRAFSRIQALMSSDEPTEQWSNRRQQENWSLLSPDRRICPLVEIGVGKFKDWVGLIESQMSFAAMLLWQVKEVPTPPICMVTGEIITYKEKRIGLYCFSWSVLQRRIKRRERNYNCSDDGTAHRQTRDGCRGKSTAKDTPGIWSGETSTWAVRN